MKQLKSMLPVSAAVGFALLTSQIVQADTRIEQLDQDTLRVVQFDGKPPHKRMTISRDRNPELYAHYLERIDHDPQPLLLSERRGAPGKSLPRQVLRVISEPAEIAEFARFEETDSDGSSDARAWRGAPGKGRRLVR